MKIWDSLAADPIEGTEDADKIDGTAAADVIDALGGDDTLTGLDGDDVLNGGVGDDHLDGGKGSDRLTGAVGDDVLIDNDGGNDTLAGFEGDDVITVGRKLASFDDTIRIRAGDGADDITYRGVASNTVKLEIDAGKDANTVAVQLAYEALIESGRHADTIEASVTNYGRVHSGGEVDQITLSSPNEISIGASLGAGDDLATLDMSNGVHYRLKLGEGSDRVTLIGAEDGVFSPLMIKDFQGGKDGDVLAVRELLLALTDWDGVSNPYQGKGDYLRIHRSGEGAVLQIDLDGGGDSWQALAILKDISPSDFSEVYNIDYGVPDTGEAPPADGFVV